MSSRDHKDLIDSINFIEAMIERLKNDKLTKEDTELIEKCLDSKK